MEIVTPEDLIVLWRSAVDGEGRQREALLHAVAREVYGSLGALDLYDDAYAQLTVESLETLDAAGLFARDSFRRCLETLREPDGGVDLLAAEIAGLLRDAAAVAHLGSDRRVHAVELAAAWREHVLRRRRPEPEYVSVGDVAARYGVTTQAVYKWLKDERIEATRGPGGSWRIPAAQFESAKPKASQAQLDDLRAHLIRMHADEDLPGEEELAAGMRGR